MSIPTGVDGDAPVRAHHETDINAPLDTVWQLHADVNAWPTWQTDITAARIDGAFQPGASFEWTSYGFTVVSTIYAVAEIVGRLALGQHLPLRRLVLRRHLLPLRLPLRQHLPLLSC
jgi:hypothetical protein